MANLKEIQDFLENLAKTDLFKIKIKTDDIEMSVQLKPDIKTATYQQPEYAEVRQIQQTATKPEVNQISKDAIPKEDDNFLTIKSPMVGTFYRKPAPDKPAFIEQGQQIKEGDIVCVIEAMKLFNEIESDLNGEIIKILIDDATPVEFDQPLFLVKPL